MFFSSALKSSWYHCAISVKCFHLSTSYWHLFIFTVFFLMFSTFLSYICFCFHFFFICFFYSSVGVCRMDEKSSDGWDLSRVAVDALGAAMLVTIILDLWRLFLGPIVPLPEGQNCLQSGLPWFSNWKLKDLLLPPIQGNDIELKEKPAKEFPLTLYGIVKQLMRFWACSWGSSSPRWLLICCCFYFVFSSSFINFRMKPFKLSFIEQNGSFFGCAINLIIIAGSTLHMVMCVSQTIHDSSNKYTFSVLWPYTVPSSIMGDRTN